MTKPCAYCGQLSQLTNEHLIPKGINLGPNYNTIVDHSRNRKVYSGEPKIKDVCGQCNNGPLSELDSFAASLSKKYFVKEICDINGCVFEYKDYSLLCRWLLKLFFNIGRAESEPGELQRFKKIAPYILGQSSDDPYAINIILGIIEPVETTQEEQKKFGCPKILFPKLSRHWRVKHELQIPCVEMSEFISFNQFVFGVVFWRDVMGQTDKLEAIKFIKKNFTFLDPFQKSVSNIKAYSDARSFVLEKL